MKKKTQKNYLVLREILVYLNCFVMSANIESAIAATGYAETVGYCMTSSRG